jgi:hypothetical protein
MLVNREEETSVKKKKPENGHDAKFSLRKPPQKK